MGILKSTGIVLSSKTAGEGDVIAAILSREFGKRKFSFKGLKKSKRRPRSAADPGNILNIVYYHNEVKEISTVKEFTVERHNLKIRDNVEKIFHLYFLLELIEKTTGYDDQNIRVYDLLEAGIKAMVDTDHVKHLTAFFILHLLRFQGIIPEFFYCKICGKKSFSGFILEITDLSPVCSNCYEGGLDIMEKNARDFIMTSLTTRFSGMDNSRYSNEDISKLILNLQLFVENYYHITLKSREFLNMRIK